MDRQGIFELYYTVGKSVTNTTTNLIFYKGINK